MAILLPRLAKIQAQLGRIENALGIPIYGVSWDKSSSPVLTRTGSSVGMTANAGVDGATVQNDFDYAPIFGDIHQVVDTLGNVFTRIPKCYIRKTDGPGFKTWQVSKKQYPGFYLPWCFWDFDNNIELPYVDVGSYQASLGEESKLESKPAYPLVSTNIVNFRTYADNNNTGGLTGYQQHDIHVQDLITTLFYIEFATLNSQSIMAGFTEGAYSDDHKALFTEENTNRIILTSAQANTYVVGQSIAVGTSKSNNTVFAYRTVIGFEDVDLNRALVFDGESVTITADNVVASRGWKGGFSKRIAASSGSIISNSTGKYPCMYRGIENPWGSVYTWVDGVNIDNRQAWVCKDASKYASNLFAGSAYEELVYTNHNANGYIKTMGFDPVLQFAEFPIEITGSTSPSLYYGDYYYPAAGEKVAFVGGAFSNAGYAGVSYWNLYHSASYSDVYRGGRLLRKASGEITE